MNPEEEGLIPPKPSVKAPANFTSPDELYKELEDSVRKYHPSDDLSLIRKAYEVALNSHGDQRRRSGEPYIIHPLCVAIILAELELDKESIAAGLLHDVVEDTPMTTEDDFKRIDWAFWRRNRIFGRWRNKADADQLGHG